VSRAEILVVDDEPDICRLLQEILEDENYSVTTAESAATARKAFHEHLPDLVLLDIWMPDTDGITLLKEWSGPDYPKVPVVIMSGHGNVETAVEATRLGAYDYIEKPVSMGKLLVTVDRALQSEKLKQENLRQRDHAEPVSALTGKSATMQQLREQIERIAATDAWVLISGQQGCGKAVAARYLHNKSARKEGRFVEVSLAAIPSKNIAVQLFGSEHEGHIIPGIFEQARGGTLLLNEIGDLDWEAQSALLHALEEVRYLRVDGHEPMEMDARIVATTSQDLEDALAGGRFREDLYYRLNVIPLRIASLREHCEDVPDLVNFYVDWLAENENLPYRKFTIGALNMLRNYSWPGNTRELKNVVRRLLITGNDLEVSVAEVEQALSSATQDGADQVSAALGPMFDIPLRDARDRFEKAYLEYHLKRTGGNVSELAAIAGMERTHLYRKLKQLGINTKQSKEEKHSEP